VTKVTLYNCFAVLEHNKVSVDKRHHKPTDAVSVMSVCLHLSHMGSTQKLTGVKTSIGMNIPQGWSNSSANFG